MGITRCPEHDWQGIAFVSPAVCAAVDSARADAACELCRVRYVFDDDDDPPGSMWLDPDFAREVSLDADRVVNLFDLDEGWVRRLRPVCGRCLESWLQRQGVDTAPSTDEREFIRIRDALRGELDATLRAFFLPPRRVGRAPQRRLAPAPVARWFDAQRGWPLVAGVKNQAAALYAACRQQDGALLCTCSAGPPSGPTIEGPSAVVSSALDEGARRALRAWAQDVLTFLVPHAAALDVLET